MALIQHVNNVLWNEKDISILEKYVAEDVDYQTPYSTGEGRSGLAADARMYYDWVKSSQSHFEAAAESDDGTVFLRWRSESLPKGEVKTYNSRGIDYYKVENGVIVSWITAHEIDSTARNKAVVSSFVERLWNDRDLSSISELVSEDVKVYISEFDWGGREKITADATRFFKGWSDSETDITHITAEGNNVVIRWETTAKHTGMYGEIPPTGKTLTYYGMDMFTVQDDNIVEIISFWDAFDVYSKLGVLEIDPSKATSDTE